MKINSEQEMLLLGARFATTCSTDHKDLARAARSVSEGHAVTNLAPNVIELVGDVGAGKTTFTRGLAKGLGVEAEITSPSFTISKSYALKNGKNLVHYDFYRLSDPGIMQDDLLENLKNDNVVVIEWGESVAGLLPENHTVVEINYNDDGSREVTIK